MTTADDRNHVASVLTKMPCDVCREPQVKTAPISMVASLAKWANTRLHICHDCAADLSAGELSPKLEWNMVDAMLRYEVIH